VLQNTVEMFAANVEAQLIRSDKASDDRMGRMEAKMDRRPGL